MKAANLKRGALGYFFPREDVVAFFSHRQTSLSRKDTHFEHRASLLLESAGLGGRRLWLAGQIHGPHVGIVRLSSQGGDFIDSDSLISAQRDAVLGILTADCLPVFLYDTKTGACGLIHGGWRSLEAGIIIATLQAMQEEFQTRPVDIWVGLGPANRVCCYEVGEEVAERFPGEVLRKSGGRSFLDLAGFACQGLLRTGVRLENIWDSCFCTSCMNKEFFSYRKEGPGCGRILSLMYSLLPSAKSTAAAPGVFHKIA